MTRVFLYVRAVSTISYQRHRVKLEKQEMNYIDILLEYICGAFLVRARMKIARSVPRRVQAQRFERAMSAFI